MNFRTFVGSSGVLLAVSMLAGCGPGLTHRAQAPTEFAQVDSEHAVGTTTLTSARVDPIPMPFVPFEPFPSDEAPAAPAAPAQISPALQTWGAPAPAAPDLAAP
jgi:hypothetical protein